jgi:hypothetical protein
MSRWSNHRKVRLAWVVQHGQYVRVEIPEKAPKPKPVELTPMLRELKALRLRRHWTIDQLAEASGMSIPCLYKWFALETKPSELSVAKMQDFILDEAVRDQVNPVAPIAEPAPEPEITSAQLLDAIRRDFDI